jgi:hypothetical protein
MFSKSLFSSKPINNVKHIINPVQESIIPLYKNDDKFTVEEYAKLNIYKETYVAHLINKNYEKLPKDLDNYVEILNTLSNLEIKTKNSTIQLLLKITMDGLIGTMNVFGLNINNIELNIKNILLQKRLDAILSGKNEGNLIVHSENNYNLEKKFTLAPLYSYYVTLFGIPLEGEGFDLNKIQMIKTILETNNINPYG